MWTDPIVAEVRAIRQEIAGEAGNDLHRLCEEAREWERANSHRLAKGTDTPRADRTPGEGPSDRPAKEG